MYVAASSNRKILWVSLIMGLLSYSSVNACNCDCVCAPTIYVTRSDCLCDAVEERNNQSGVQTTTLDYTTTTEAYTHWSTPSTPTIVSSTTTTEEDTTSINTTTEEDTTSINTTTEEETTSIDTTTEKETTSIDTTTEEDTTSIDTTTEEETTTTKTPLQCTNGFTLQQVDGVEFCLGLTANLSSHTEGQKDCERLGAKGLWVNSRNELDRTYAWITSQNGRFKPFWTSGFKVNRQYSWLATGVNFDSQIVEFGINPVDQPQRFCLYTIQHSLWDGSNCDATLRTVCRMQ